MHVEKLKDGRVLVVGDTMLDVYHFGKVDRISPEAPIPVVQVKKTVQVLGGAANVAHNVSTLGGKAILVGLAGDDANREVLNKLLDEKSIENLLVTSPAPTITKTRVLGASQQIVRMDFEEIIPQSKDTQAALARIIREASRKAEIFVISDYGKGVCSPEICALILELAKEQNKTVIVDPKGADWNKYAGADVVSPNVKELGEAFGASVTNEDAALEEAGRFLIAKYSLKHLLVTRSERGMTFLKPGATLHIPTEAREVYDVSGAGDTVVATLAAGLSVGFSWEESVNLSNVAAGIVVGKTGTAPVHLQELEASFFDSKEQEKIIKRGQLPDILASLKKEKKRLVFTNGVFDLLHRGHITYLREARSRGDALMVALNSDASVKRLKGPERPIKDEDERAFIMSALEFVDFVIIFDEDTPYELLSIVKPDLLIKGGDYKIDQIVGREFAGETEVIPFVDGYSTTKTIQKMKV